ncbi:hypothetical protein PR202_gb13694 [Eleusine coracana subsp. coracana]|uniref:Calponin-homology (CH) domain-containing protein n=1 Tax=Eleusine coracana subsp. coracana TaxID=191504 RepID=A0AAV5EQW2_ELECO|nr:hypothetical protein PR202_gb13694 [Eleusine coracana subsp. coracana]
MASPEQGAAVAAAVVENVMRLHSEGGVGVGGGGGETVGAWRNIDIAWRKAEEAAIRRYEAANWLRRIVGVVSARDLAEEPSEDEFRIGLRNGIILCNALNKVQPGSVPKVVEVPSDSTVPTDGAALCAYQYFENVRNFVIGLQDLGLPTFEASDLEKAMIRSHSAELLRDGISQEPIGHEFSLESTETTSDSIRMLVQTVLSDKKPEEVPSIVESLLSKVIHEFESRIANQNESVRSVMDSNESNTVFRTDSPEVESKSTCDQSGEDPCILKEDVSTLTPRTQNDNSVQKLVQSRPETNFDQQQKQIQDLKNNLCTIKSGMEDFKLLYCEDLTKLGNHLRVISHAASGYHKLVEENRKLYNQIQDLRGNIRVYCRVRPFLPGKSGPKILTDEGLGVNYRALNDLFSIQEQRKDTFCYEISVQMIEIYNEQVRDLLQNGGQAKTLMFVHIAPEPDAVSESISTLKFAERVATVELGAAKSNKEGAEVKELKEQIACLRAALARKDVESDHIRRTQSSPDIYRMRMGKRHSVDEVGNLEPFIKEAAQNSNGVGLGRATEDSDDFEVATSCSSEQDCVRPASAPKASGFANGAARKGQSKGLKSSDIRGVNPAKKTSPLQKKLNGPSPMPIKKSAVEGKRTPNGKVSAKK